jgi:hypothetical protein
MASKNVPWCIFSIEIGGKSCSNFISGFVITVQIKVMASEYFHHETSRICKLVDIYLSPL